MSITNQVNTSAEALSRRLGLPEKETRNCLGYWQRLIPYQHREDVIQDMVLELLKVEPANAGLMFAICRQVVSLWWRKARQRDNKAITESMDALMGDDSGSTLSRAFVDAINYEALAVGNVSASELWQRLPDWVKDCVRLRLEGKNVNGRRAGNLNQWAKEHANWLLATS